MKTIFFHLGEIFLPKTVEHVVLSFSTCVMQDGRHPTPYEYEITKIGTDSRAHEIKDL